MTIPPHPTVQGRQVVPGQEIKVGGRWIMVADVLDGIACRTILGTGPTGAQLIKRIIKNAEYPCRTGFIPPCERFRYCETAALRDRYWPSDVSPLLVIDDDGGQYVTCTWHVGWDATAGTYAGTRKQRFNRDRLSRPSGFWAARRAESEKGGLWTRPRR